MEPNEQERPAGPTPETGEPLADPAPGSAEETAEGPDGPNGNDGPDADRESGGPGQKPRFSIHVWLALTAVLVVISILLTYTLTSAAQRSAYRKALAGTRDATAADGNRAEQDAENLKTLESVLRAFSFYSDSLDDETMLSEAFKAYVRATGDRYAAYYTEAEYEQLREGTSGAYSGIGVTIEPEQITDGDGTRNVFAVVSVLKDGPAARAGILTGEWIDAVETSEGVFETVDALGHDRTIAAVHGEEGTVVRLRVLHRDGEFYVPRTVECVRGKMESVSAEGRILAGYPDVAVVRVSSFALNTPEQFRAAVDECRANGAEKFIFDVRDDPGGDLQSIRAVLSSFLQKGDLILEARDQKGEARIRTLCEPVTNVGDYVGCNVTEEQIGQYRDLDFVILCNERTASAAEVFTATLRDHGLARAIVGKTTYGKGIMQSTFRLPFRNIVAYVKLTTYQYVTQCGVSYNGTGIAPTNEVGLAEEARSKPIEDLTWEEDLQLQTAVGILTGVS